MTPGEIGGTEITDGEGEILRFAITGISCKIYHPATKSTSASSSNGPEEPAAHKCLENHG